jgi:hypothetical protein
MKFPDFFQIVGVVLIPILLIIFFFWSLTLPEPTYQARLIDEDGSYLVDYVSSTDGCILITRASWIHSTPYLRCGTFILKNIDD